MRPEIRQIDPRGRLDVLAYRVLDRLAARHCPAEWPAIEPVAWEMCSRLGPQPKRRHQPQRRYRWESA